MFDENTLNEAVTRMFDLISSKGSNGSIDPGKLLQELKKFIYRYHMDLESSERAILLENGVSENDIMSASVVFKNISAIGKDDKSISVVARVNSIIKRQIKDGRPVWNVDIEDETSTIVLTIWDENIATRLKIGKTYRIIDCYSKEYNGIVNITLGRSGSITEGNDVKMSFDYSHLEAKITKLSDLKPGQIDLTVGGTIRTLCHKQVNGYDGPTTICEGTLSDGDLAVTFSDWANRDYNPGDYVFMIDVQIKEFRNVPYINLNKKSRVIVKV